MVRAHVVALAVALFLGTVAAPVLARDKTRNVVFEDRFDDGVVDEARWPIADGVVENDDCGSVSDPYALKFDGNDTRVAATKPLDLRLGGTLEFELRTGRLDEPCEETDENEDVVLEYSTGSGWTELARYDEDRYEIGFRHVEVDVPDGARSSETRFRWRQPFTDVHVDGSQDHAAIDDVRVVSPKPVCVPGPDHPRRACIVLVERIDPPPLHGERGRLNVSVGGEWIRQDILVVRAFGQPAPGTLDRQIGPATLDYTQEQTFGRVDDAWRARLSVHDRVSEVTNLPIVVVREEVGCVGPWIDPFPICPRVWA